MSVGLDSMLTHPVVGPSNQAQVDAVKSILGMAGGALAGGALARGLPGIGSFLHRELGGGAKTPQRQSYVRIPVPVRVRSKAERDAMLGAAQEIDKEAQFAKLAEGAMDWAAKHIASGAGLLRAPGEQPGLLQNTFGGWGESGKAQMPWAPLAMAGAVGGGLYGGWKLTDYLLDKTRSAEQESELEQARKEYESALAGRRKVASAAPSPLDALADHYEKRGWMNEALGAALLGGGAAALGAGVGTYKWTRSLADDKAIEEAVKRRQAQIAEQAPSPIIAIPTPMPVYHQHKPLSHRLAEHSKPYLHDLAGRLGMGDWGAGAEDGAGDGESDGDLPAEFVRHKAANIGQAADEFLGRMRSNQMATWNQLMTPVDAKPAKPVKPEPPPPPRLPTLAGQGSAGYLPTTSGKG